MYVAQTQPYTVPGARRADVNTALVLAIVMHGLLGGMLFFGLQWQSHPADVVSAELWSALPQVAAPAPAPAPPPVQASTPAPPQVVEEPPPPAPPHADIVIKEEAPKKAPPPKVEPAPAPPPRKVEKPVAKPEPRPEVKAAPAAPSQLAELLNQAKADSGTQSQSSGPRGTDRYKAAIAMKIRSNTRYPPPPGTEGNPTVQVRIEQLPNGEVTAATILHSSGLPTFDEAVVRAIQASSPLPKDDDGRVVTPIVLDYRLFENR